MLFSKKVSFALRYRHRTHPTSFVELRPGPTWTRLPSDLRIRSLLRVPVRIKDEPIGAISFGADRPAVYEDDDVELARRIADHIALALAHERLAEEAGRAARAQERASMLEERVSSLVQELKPRCASCPWRVRAVEACARRCNEVAATDTTVLITGSPGLGRKSSRATSTADRSAHADRSSV